MKQLKQLNELVIDGMDIYDPITKSYPIEDKTYKQFQRLLDEADESVRKIEYISNKVLTESNPIDRDIHRILIMMDCARSALNKLETAKKLDEHYGLFTNKNPLVEEQEEVRSDT